MGFLDRAIEVGMRCGVKVSESLASREETALSLLRLAGCGDAAVVTAVQQAMMSAVGHPELEGDILVQYNAACICALLGLEDDCRNRMEVSLRLNVAAPASETNRLVADDIVDDADLLSVKEAGWFAGLTQALRFNDLAYHTFKA